MKYMLCMNNEIRRSLIWSFVLIRNLCECRSSKSIQIFTYVATRENEKGQQRLNVMDATKDLYECRSVNMIFLVQIGCVNQHWPLYSTTKTMFQCESTVIPWWMVSLRAVHVHFSFSTDHKEIAHLSYLRILRIRCSVEWFLF